MPPTTQRHTSVGHPGVTASEPRAGVRVAGTETAPVRRSAVETCRAAAATGLEVTGFALHAIANQLERRGVRLGSRSLPARADDWTSGTGVVAELDRSGAAAWALANVDEPGTIESNCAYFVSEALRVGGRLAETTGWRPGTTSSRVRRWHRIARHPAYGCVGDFVIEMQRVGYARLIGTDTMLASPPGAEIGDVIVYNWDGRGRYQHLALVTEFDDGLMRVTQQTPSQRNRPWNRYGDGRWIETASLLRFAASR